MANAKILNKTNLKLSTKELKLLVALLWKGI
jgi:hypothetical protein